MNWEYFAGVALESLVPIVCSIVGVLILNWIKKKTDNEQINTLVNSALYIVDQAVKSVNQTFVNGLKADGGFTPEKQAEAKEKCKQIVSELLSDSMKLALETTYGSLNVLLDTLIESSVLDNKTSYLAVENSPVISGF